MEAGYIVQEDANSAGHRRQVFTSLALARAYRDKLIASGIACSIYGAGGVMDDQGVKDNLRRHKDTD